jgi:hypothetical protein
MRSIRHSTVWLKGLSKTFTPKALMISLAFNLAAITASAESFAYVITSNQQFGIVHLPTGKFTQIGPNTPETEAGLIPAKNGSLLTLTFSGKLEAIDPATGRTSVIGATGLGDCSTPSSPCPSTSANTIGELGGTIYAIDISNNLYRINPVTGAASLIGPTGLPSAPIPFSSNPDGSFNFYDSALFEANGNLYYIFDTGKESMSSGPTPVIPASLYQINPFTGRATLVAPTTFSLDAVTEENGGFYTFINDVGQVATFDLANGNTSFVSNLDPSAGLIFGASPVREQRARFLLRRSQ